MADSSGKHAADKSTGTLVDPFESIKTQNAPFETVLSDSPVDAAAYLPPRTRWETKQTNFDEPAIVAPQNTGELPAPTSTNAAASPANATAKDPCAAAQFQPIGELGINIAQPAGQKPTDFATPCWEQINSGPNALCRCWPVMCYQWEATRLCYQPLYFEEANAERYGYVCCCCWQPAASAAHFFGTIPALPYCLAAECPTTCVYALGHYRPGDCVPWRRHWPPCDPMAAITTGGVYTGLVFAIP